MAKTQKVEKVAVVLSDGTEHDIDDALVRKYGLSAGSTTPFSRANTTTVIREVKQKRGSTGWTSEEDGYLLSHWETVAGDELARRLTVSPAVLAKRHKKLIADQQAAEKAARRAAGRTKKKTAAGKKKKASKTKTKKGGKR